MPRVAKKEAPKEPKVEPKKEIKLIPFKNGKRLKKADSYPPETMFLYEIDYKEIIKAKKDGRLKESGLTADQLAKRIIDYRKEQQKILEAEMFEEASSALFGVRNPRDLRKKTIKPGEGYRLIPFWNGTIPGTRKNHPPGTIFITLIEYNCLASALKAGDIKQRQVHAYAKRLIEIRKPYEIEGIEEYIRQHPPKPRKKKKREDSRIFATVDGERLYWESDIRKHHIEKVLWLTGKELYIVQENGCGRQGLLALLDVVKNYKLPLVNGRRVSTNDLDRYQEEEIEYVRMKAYIEDRIPLPELSEVIAEQEDKTKALAKDIAEETAKRFIDEIVPQELAQYLTQEQLIAQAEEFGYAVAEKVVKMTNWELAQTRIDAKKVREAKFKKKE